jgi:hypothetical protein
MSHDPALDAHEHSEHAAHAAHENNPFISRVSITIAVLAVVAAAAGSLESLEAGSAITTSSEAVLHQDRATDAWAQFQANSIKKNIYTVAAASGGNSSADFERNAKEQSDKQEKAQDRAKDEEKESAGLSRESTSHERRHHWLTAAATITEIGIALSTVAIITRRSPLWYGALALGTIGVVLLGVAYSA